MIRWPSQPEGSAHIHGNPAIHTGHRGNDPGILPAVYFLLALGAIVETSHVHLVPLYVGEAPFVDEKLADAAELSVVMPEFCSALYPVLPLCVN
jgi:hypothetical protein